MAIWTDQGAAPAWAAATFFDTNELCVGDGIVWRAVVGGNTGGVEPDWTDPQPIVDNEVEWEELPAWAPGTTYPENADIQPTVPNGHAYESDLGGVSGPTEPTWPLTGGDVSDGGSTGDPDGGVAIIQVFPRDDIGSAVLTLTDANIFAGPLFRDAENELGAVGPIIIRRDHPDAHLLETGMYVKVTIPAISDNPIFGGWLDEGYDKVVGEGEEATEVVARGGPGAIAVLRHARLLDDWHSTSPFASDQRGSVNADGVWRWINEPFGAILTRVVEEGQDQPGTPLAGVTIDFDREDDSASDPWPTVTGKVEMKIGTDGLTAYGVLISSGQLYVRPDPDLNVSAYGTAAYGTDRTSTTFATGKVRFTKGINILSNLDREAGDSEGIRNAAGRGTPVGSLPELRGGRGASAPVGTVASKGPGRNTHATHALVEGADGVYRQVVSPLYSAGIGRWTTVPYGESDDTALLDDVGAEALARGEMGRQALTFEILPGDDEANGLYLPYVHFFIGDLVTVHTGDADGDFTNYTSRVTGITAVLTEATDDSTAEMAIRSIRWYVELNGSPSRGISAGGGSIDCCGCKLGTQVPGSDPPAYYGEMYLGGYTETPGGTLQFCDGTRAVNLAYVPGTASWFSGTVSDGVFTPDGRAWTAGEDTPESGLVVWTAPASADTGRILARVSCADWLDPEPPE